tara:strand:+ start:377 stop:793 length:417 start_codon:yes stop_codon:yes gene_type:complete
MSLSIGNRTIEKMKVVVTESKLNPGQPIYSITMDENEYYGRPELSFKVGRTYKFEFDTLNHPFYITTDEHGGGSKRNPTQSMIGTIQIIPENSNESGNVGLVTGSLTWTPQYHHQEMNLYYQCNDHPHMGNQIHITLV